MPSPTLLWLRTHSAPYPHSDRVYDHVAAALAAYPTLRPKADVYAHDDGRTHLLICLHGILPIVFRNAPYNIPIALWLVRDYPRQPPIPYVVPTTGILVKPGRFVDLSGRCSLDYIQHWQRKSEGCNLLALIQSMQDLFSRDPPLYAKPPPPALHSSVQSPPTTPSPFPIPTERPPQYWNPRDTPLPRSWPPPPPPPLLPAPDLLDEDAPHAPSPPASSSPPPPRPPNPELIRLQTQAHHKLSSELASFSRAFAIDADRLRDHQTGLLAGEPAVRDEVSRLEAVRDVCQNVSGRLRGLIAQGEANVTELRRKGDPEVDELVCSTSIVHNQLVNLVAEDNAIEDTIYHLHRALNTGRIDLDRFLRSTRILAEDQFMKRALIEKIHVGMPPP